MYIEKPKVAFSIFHFVLLYFSLSNECPGLCRNRPGHSLGKKIKTHEKKNGKSNFGFSNIWNIANFEVFCWNILLSANLLFLKSDTLVTWKLICVFFQSFYSWKKIPQINFFIVKISVYKIVLIYYTWIMI